MPGIENRKDPRTAIAVEVNFESDNTFYSGVTDNVSSSGVFVATDAPPSAGSTIALDLKLDGYNNPFKLDGKVLWVREPHMASEFSPAGMGVRWINLSHEAKQAITSFVKARDSELHDDADAPK